MSALSCSVHFLTLRQQEYDESNVAVTFYHEPSHFAHQQRNVYAKFTHEFNMQQARHFTLDNAGCCSTLKTSKAAKLRDKLRQLDALLSAPNAHVAKIVWLSPPTRLVLVMRDSMLVWLTIDAVSGDLLKLLVDKSLMASAAVRTPSAQPPQVSDAVMIATMPAPALVLVYSNESFVDVVRFKKAAAFVNYYTTTTTTTTTKLLALDSFDIQRTTHDFNFPASLHVDKHLALVDQSSHSSSSSSSSFAIWWSNDLQQAQAKSGVAGGGGGGDGLSVLERDDMRTNVLVMSLGDAKRPLDCLFKSNGTLLALHYLSANKLVAVEQQQQPHQSQQQQQKTQQQGAQLTIFHYDLSTDEVTKESKIRKHTLHTGAPVRSPRHVRIARKHVLILTAADQTLVLYDMERELVHKHKLHAAVSSASTFSETGQRQQRYRAVGVEWLVDDLVFSVDNGGGGRLCLFDMAFNRLDVAYMSRYPIEFHSLAEYLNSSCTPLQQQQQHSVSTQLVSSNVVHRGSLWSCFVQPGNGPLGLFRLSLGGGGGGGDQFSAVTLVNYYMAKCSRAASRTNAHHHLTSAVNLLCAMDWESEPNKCLACFCQILNWLLTDRVELNEHSEALAEKALASFYRPAKALSAKRVHTLGRHVGAYARKYFFRLLRELRLNKAYLLAVDCGAMDLFNDLYYSAMERGETLLVELCRKKFHELREARPNAIDVLGGGDTVAAVRDRSKSREMQKTSATRRHLSRDLLAAESDEDSASLLSSEYERSDGLSLRSDCGGDSLVATSPRAKARQIALADSPSPSLMSMMSRAPDCAYSEANIHQYAMQLCLENEFVYRLGLNNGVV